MNNHVYDKAKYHLGEIFPEGLDPFQTNIHIGMYVGWLIEKDFISDFFKENAQEEIEKFKNREMTGPQLLERSFDGTLVGDMLNQKGNDFSMNYYGKGYFNDYEALAPEDMDLFEIQDTWDNYEKIKNKLDERFIKWESSK